MPRNLNRHTSEMRTVRSQKLDFRFYVLPYLGTGNPRSGTLLSRYSNTPGALPRSHTHIHA